MGSTTMHHVLIAVPFPEPPGATDVVRKSHPGFKVTYIQLMDPNPMSGKHDIPDGKETSDDARQYAKADSIKETWSDVTILVTLAALPRDPALAPNLSKLRSPEQPVRCDH